MNFQMLVSRKPEDIAIIKDQLVRLTGRMKTLAPEIANRRNEFEEAKKRLGKEGEMGFFFTDDWEIDLGVFTDTGKTPTRYDEMEFYVLTLIYIEILRLIMMQEMKRAEESAMAYADDFFFHVKDLAAQGNSEAQQIYEKLRKLRSGKG